MVAKSLKLVSAIENEVEGVEPPQENPNEAVYDDIQQVVEEEQIETPVPSIENIENIEPSIESPLVSCPKCSKKMTAKTYKYTHNRTCGKPKTNNVQDIPNDEPPTPIPPTPAPMPPKLTRAISKRTESPVRQKTITEERAERVKIRSSRMNALFQQAF